MNQQILEGDWNEIKGQLRQRWGQWIERFVGRRPAICLGAAFSFGIALGWWVKRL